MLRGGRRPARLTAVAVLLLVAGRGRLWRRTDATPAAPESGGRRAGPAADKVAPRWEEVARFAGTGDQRTDGFDIAPDAIQWRVTLACTDGTVRVGLDGEPVGAWPSCPAARGTPSGSRSAPARPSLDVDATGAWEIVVDQQVDTPVAEPALAGMTDATRRATGDFYGIDQKGSGTATLYRLPGGGRRPAPRPVRRHQELRPVRVGERGGRAHAPVPRPCTAPTCRSSRLTATAGAQNYLLPDTVDLRPGALGGRVVRAGADRLRGGGAVGVRRRAGFVVLLVAVAGGASAGCGSSTSDDGGPPATTVAADVARWPTWVVGAPGTIVVPPPPAGLPGSVSGSTGALGGEWIEKAHGVRVGPHQGPPGRVPGLRPGGGGRLRRRGRGPPLAERPPSRVGYPSERAAVDGAASRVLAHLFPEQPALRLDQEAEEGAGAPGVEAEAGLGSRAGGSRSGDRLRRRRRVATGVGRDPARRPSRPARLLAAAPGVGVAAGAAPGRDVADVGAARGRRRPTATAAGLRVARVPGRGPGGGRHRPRSDRRPAPDRQVLGGRPGDAAARRASGTASSSTTWPSTGPTGRRRCAPWPWSTWPWPTPASPPGTPSTRGGRPVPRTPSRSCSTRRGSRSWRRPLFPAYVSGHSTYSAAVAVVLAHLFPADAERFRAMGEEAGLSRLYGGIHWRSDHVAGSDMGREIGALVVAAGPGGLTVGRPDRAGVGAHPVRLGYGSGGVADAGPDGATPPGAAVERGRRRVGRRALGAGAGAVGLAAHVRAVLVLVGRAVGGRVGSGRGGGRGVPGLGHGRGGLGRGNPGHAQDDPARPPMPRPAATARLDMSRLLRMDGPFVGSGTGSLSAPTL